MKKQKPLILVVDDEIDLLEILRTRLTDAGYRILTAHNGERAIAETTASNPDLIILDVTMPMVDGIEVKNRLNESPATANIPVIFLTAKDAAEDRLAGLRLRADDYLTKPFQFDELAVRIDNILRKKVFYEDIATTDQLTGLNNIQVFSKEAAALFKIAKRYKRVFSLGVIDIDRFKEINDTFGHQTGNLVIRKIAEIMRRVFRQPDILIRYGGDEFVVLLPESGREQSRRAFSRLCEEVTKTPLTVEGVEQPIPVTISTGLATYDDALQDEDELFELADKSMYADKESHRRSV